MADNGYAGSVFRDRKGENPFAPVVPVKPKVRKDHARPVRPELSYNGMGTSTPNGNKPTQLFNGMTFPRENPDVVNRTKKLNELGERSA